METQQSFKTVKCVSCNYTFSIKYICSKCIKCENCLKIPKSFNKYDNSVNTMNFVGHKFGGQLGKVVNLSLIGEDIAKSVKTGNSREITKSTAKGIAGFGGEICGTSLGAGIGSSVLPGIGTIVGGVVGGLVGELAVGSTVSTVVDEVFDGQNIGFVCEKCKSWKWLFRLSNIYWFNLPTIVYNSTGRNLHFNLLISIFSIKLHLNFSGFHKVPTAQV